MWISTGQDSAVYLPLISPLYLPFFVGGQVDCLSVSMGLALTVGQDRSPWGGAVCAIPDSK
jgi:hypothetical protein